MEMRTLGRTGVEVSPLCLGAMMFGIERELLPVTQEYGMGTLVWSPLAGGWLSGTWRKGADAPKTHRASAMGGRMASRYDLSDPINQRKLDAADALAGVAEQAGVSLPQLAVAFTIRHPGVTSSIIGPRSS